MSTCWSTTSASPTRWPAEDKPIEEFERTLDTNLTGAFRCTQAVGDVMIAEDGALIVNISSMSAFIANHPQCHADYQASKAGLEGLKTQLASEWAGHGMRINDINPGYVLTDILRKQFEDDPELEDVWLEEVLQSELAELVDIAPLAVYLASDASSYVTGESIVIDGGYTVQ